MFKHHFVTALISLLLLIATLQSAYAQSQLAQDTYAIFEASCLNCHGPDGAFRETLLMEHSRTYQMAAPLFPGNPDASELYMRLLGPTKNGAQMPFGLPPTAPLNPLRSSDAGYWQAHPIGRQPQHRSAASLTPAKCSQVLSRTSTHSHPLTAPSHDTLR